MTRTATITLAALALAAPPAAADTISPGLSQGEYKVSVYECDMVVDYDTGEELSWTCRSLKWCKGTPLKPHSCVRVAPWTRGTRSR